VQPGEACDGDGPDGYCVACKSLVKPNFAFTVDYEAHSVLSHPTPSSTWFFGDVEKNPVSGTLPAQGDAKGCGAVKILESTADHTRIEWTHCSSDGQDVSTITFALPRTKVDVTDAASAPPPLQAQIRVHDVADAKEQTWTMADADIFELSGGGDFRPNDHVGGGSVRFSFKKTEPGSFDEDTAFLSIFYTWVPPVLP
jgi:hypothetical protein